MATFIERLRALGLDPDNFVVVGSGLLDVLGIRTADDIDLVVSHSLYEELSQHPSWVMTEVDGHELLQTKGSEAWLAWDNDGKPNFDELVGDNNVVAGYNFVTLARLRRWKVEHDRPKDQRDVVLIDAYLRQPN